MQVKFKPRAEDVELVKGRPAGSRFVEVCHDQLRVYPSSACTNFSCPFSLSAPVYMNCSFVVAQAREGDGLSLQAIGDMMGLTRERIRQIEMKAARKLRERLGVSGVGSGNGSSPGESCVVAGPSSFLADLEGVELSDEPDLVLVVGDRGMD